ncbi:MAG TPA: FAD-dependent oxidoreductase [Pyrinomonadaceae bacterium]|jgi:pyruvate/2-oxoglutarate dehydrogenase complex dihydrolipoamide dehydrogenase (E3) component
MSENYDFVVIGGGSAGLVAAGGVGLLGAKVLLVEKRALGGDCLYTGCVPSKALIRSARFAADVKRAGDFGFRIADFGFQNDDFASITKRVRQVIETIERHESPERFEKMGVEVVFGEPRFLNGREIEIRLKTGETRRIRAKRFCIATGSSAAIPPVEGLAETGFQTNETIFEIKDLPEKLIVLGGGAIGAELGQAFARFGSRVTIIEMDERILAKEDREVSEFIETVFRAEGTEVLTKTKAVKVRTENGKKFVVVERGGESFEIEADEILVAAGRKPNLDGLDLEKAGVRFEKNRIITDEFLRTTAKHIFAAGDVTGHFQFTHAADYEAQTVINNAFLFRPFLKKVDYRAVPWATFCEPEIGRVGLTEAEARSKFGDKIKVYRVNFDENDRAQTEGEIAGFAKIVCKTNGEIVGAHLVGAGAGEIIHEFVWAITNRLKISELNRIVRVYPTLSKIVQAAGTEATIETLKSPFVQRWFGRYLKLWR